MNIKNNKSIHAYAIFNFFLRMKGFEWGKLFILILNKFQLVELKLILSYDTYTIGAVFSSVEGFGGLLSTSFNSMLLLHQIQTYPTVIINCQSILTLAQTRNIFILSISIFKNYNQGELNFLFIERSRYLGFLIFPLMRF